MRAHRLFELAAPLPIALWLLVSWYVRRYDGWGAWAAAPLFVPVLALSAIMGVSGAVFWYRERRAGGSGVRMLTATLAAGSISLWFLVKALYLEFERSF
jgi:hypothetical protein